MVKLFILRKQEMGTASHILEKQGFLKVAKTSELTPGSMQTFDVNGEQILIANVDGTYYAMGAICRHEEWDLSDGTLEDHKVTCLGHGAIWDLESGQGEFVEELPPEPTYEIEVDGEDVLVNPVARERAA